MQYRILTGMPRATAVLREKVIDEEGNILELVIWRVPATPRSPSGVRYRLAFVRRDEENPAVLYDNHSPKGHHRHIEGVEERTVSRTSTSCWRTS
jgi:hypothetical protein